MTTSPPTEDEPAEIRAVSHPTTADIADVGLLRLLQSSRELVDLNQIATMCGINSRQATSRWRRAMENYVLRHHDQWPPTMAALRGEVDNPGGPEIDALPPHPNVLPPPAITGDGGRAQARWYAGDIYRWAMRTRRISLLDCKPIIGMARRSMTAARTGPALRTSRVHDSE